jgi:plastocyanin
MLVPIDCPSGRSLTESALVSVRSLSLRHVLAFGFAALLAAPAIADDVPLFKLVARDGVFEPTVVEVPAGKRVRLEIRNEGKTPMEFESRDLKQEKVIPPGGKATVTINAMKAGEYKLFDEFHEKTGQGKFVVK